MSASRREKCFNELLQMDFWGTSKGNAVQWMGLYKSYCPDVWARQPGEIATRMGNDVGGQASCN